MVAPGRVLSGNLRVWGAVRPEAPLAGVLPGVLPLSLPCVLLAEAAAASMICCRAAALRCASLSRATCGG